MELIIKNKVFSLGGSSRVIDEMGKEPYKVKGKVFSITKKKKVCDMEGNVLYIVKNKFYSWKKKEAMIYNADEEQILKISQGDYDFRNRFKVEDYSDEMTVEGKAFSFGYDININGEQVARITKKFRFFAIGDSFTLETEDEKNVPLYIALTIAIDNISDRKSKEK